jgi:hypothetical protein
MDRRMTMRAVAEEVLAGQHPVTPKPDDAEAGGA